MGQEQHGRLAADGGDADGGALRVRLVAGGWWVVGRSPWVDAVVSLLGLLGLVVVGALRCG